MLLLPAAALCCLCSALVTMAAELIQDEFSLTSSVGGTASFSCGGTDQCYDYVFWYQKKDTGTFTLIFRVEKSDGSTDFGYSHPQINDFTAEIKDNSYKQVVKPMVSVYPAASRALDGKSVLLCVASDMSPPLVHFSWKRQKEGGPLEDLTSAQGEQLELRVPERTAAIMVVDRDASYTYKYRCNVRHEGGRVEAAAEQEVPALPSTTPPSTTSPSTTPLSETPTSETSPSKTSPTKTPPSKTPTSETPPSKTPPSATPPSRTPPSETSPSETSPSKTPPSKTPPSETSPTKTPPSKTPTSETSPSKTPPSATPPSRTPPSETSPSKTPPSETSPSETPPSETPPSRTPPSETSPSKTPPSETSPSRTPPSETSPSKTPPSETSPSKTTPSKTPPSATPPSKTPPSETSPSTPPPSTPPPSTPPPSTPPPSATPPAPTWSQQQLKLLCLLYTVLMVKSLVYCCGLSLINILRNRERPPAAHKRTELPPAASTSH